MKKLLLSTILAISARGQTQVPASALKCPPPLAGTSTWYVPAGSILTVQGVQVVSFVCAIGDSSTLALDKTTTPPTLRAILPAPSPGPTPRIQVREVPAGTIDGKTAVFTLSSAPASNVIAGVEQLPTLVYRNGLLLTACPIGVTVCNGDYQISGTTILFLVQQNAVPTAGDLISVVYWK